MPSDTKPHNGHSPWAILTELAVEGTSSLVEAQRTLLNLAQQENDLILNGVKERIAGFMPAVAITDLVQKSLDAFIGMQQEFLTTASKQTVHWLEVEKLGTSQATAELLDSAREGVEAFARAQKKFLDAVAEQADKAVNRKRDHDGKAVNKTEFATLARQAADAFVEAQKRLLDVSGQQMSVNLQAATRTMELLSPARLIPLTSVTGEGARKIVEAQKSLLGSLMMPNRKPTQKAGRSRTARKGFNSRVKRDVVPA